MSIWLQSLRWFSTLCFRLVNIQIQVWYCMTCRQVLWIIHQHWLKGTLHLLPAVDCQKYVCVFMRIQLFIPDIFNSDEKKFLMNGQIVLWVGPQSDFDWFWENSESQIVLCVQTSEPTRNQDLFKILQKGSSTKQCLHKLTQMFHCRRAQWGMVDSLKGFFGLRSLLASSSSSCALDCDGENLNKIYIKFELN